MNWKQVSLVLCVVLVLLLAGCSGSTDADRDGLNKSIEAKHGLDDSLADFDEDGLNDSREYHHPHLNPSTNDTDHDGLHDEQELHNNTNVTIADTDGDGAKDGIEIAEGSNPLTKDSDGDRLLDSQEHKIGTNPSLPDTDGDGRSDFKEQQIDSLSPTEQDITVIEGSPQAGLANGSLQEDALGAVKFLGELPGNRTKRDEVVTQTATSICTAHESVVANVSANASGVGGDAYRNTYRVAHSAEVLHELGADIDPAVINQRMQTTRRVSGLAAKYTPVFGSYQRLCAASCAVKAGKPGAKQGFYIAAAEFTVDLAFAQQNVMYKAAFTTTGKVAQKVGTMRLARVCGYKCVGLVESELHWVVRGTYSGALDQVSKNAIDGNLTTDGWNQSTRESVGEYLENTTGTTYVGGELVPDAKAIKCVNKNIDIKSLWSVTQHLSSDAVTTLRTILEEQRIPESIDLSFIEDVDSVNRCVQSD